MSNRAYVILNASEAEAINYSQVLETSFETLRFSTDQSQTFVKYTGVTPDWLVGKTSYNKAEMLEILNNPDGNWLPPEL
jgi:hypothetical protein